MRFPLKISKNNLLKVDPVLDFWQLNNGTVPNMIGDLLVELDNFKPAHITEATGLAYILANSDHIEHSTLAGNHALLMSRHRSVLEQAVDIGLKRTYKVLQQVLKVFINSCDDPGWECSDSIASLQQLPRDTAECRFKLKSILTSLRMARNTHIANQRAGGDSGECLHASSKDEIQQVLFALTTDDPNFNILLQCVVELCKSFCKYSSSEDKSLSSQCDDVLLAITKLTGLNPNRHHKGFKTLDMHGLEIGAPDISVILLIAHDSDLVTKMFALFGYQRFCPIYRGGLVLVLCEAILEYKFQKKVRAEGDSISINSMTTSRVEHE